MTSITKDSSFVLLPTHKTSVKSVTRLILKTNCLVSLQKRKKGHYIRQFHVRLFYCMWPVLQR